MRELERVADLSRSIQPDDCSLKDKIRIEFCLRVDDLLDCSSASTIAAAAAAAAAAIRWESETAVGRVRGERYCVFLARLGKRVRGDHPRGSGKIRRKGLFGDRIGTKGWF